MKRIYFDNAATTQVDNEVLKAMQPYFSSKYGNASSLHSFGREAKDALEESREKIAKLLKVKTNEIIFTSGGTESNNMALKRIACESKGKHIITSRIEHPSILETCRLLEKKGFKISYLNVNKEGIVSLDELKKAIAKDTILVSVMHVNNEIGTIQPIEEIGKICREKGVYFHTDAVQSFGKIKLNLENVDLASFNAHKIYGPKGVGALYVKEGTNIKALLHGGKHEFGLRAGTENIPGIAGFAKAAEIAYRDMEDNDKKIKELRERALDGILQIKDVFLNGSKEKRLSNNINVSFRYIEGESLVLRLDNKGIACSTGSACSTKELKPSHVLLAIGLKHEEAHGSLRISLGKYNTKEEVEYFLKVLPEVVNELRRISPFAK